MSNIVYVDPAVASVDELMLEFLTASLEGRPRLYVPDQVIYPKYGGYAPIAVRSCGEGGVLALALSENETTFVRLSDVRVVRIRVESPHGLADYRKRIITARKKVLLARIKDVYERADDRSERTQMLYDELCRNLLPDDGQTDAALARVRNLQGMLNYLESAIAATDVTAEDDNLWIGATQLKQE